MDGLKCYGNSHGQQKTKQKQNNILCYVMYYGTLLCIMEHYLYYMVRVALYTPRPSSKLTWPSTTPKNRILFKISIIEINIEFKPLLAYRRY